MKNPPLPPKDRLFQGAMRFLSVRLRSEREIRTYLVKKSVQWHLNHPPIEEVIALLKDYRYVDDRAFAEEWISSRIRIRQKSIRVLRAELKRMGIDREIVDDALSQKFSPGTGISEEELAIKSIERKDKHWRKLPHRDHKIKLIGFLLRRGFSEDVIRRVVDETLKNNYNKDA